MWPRFRRVLCGCLVVLAGCNSVESKPPRRSGETVRYRLLLRDNPVSPQDAVHCYGACQSEPTPQSYVECLSKCPGFEMTLGEYCSNTEIPPAAACLTVRKIPISKEPPPGLVVLAVVGSFALAVTAVSLCSLSATQCGAVVPPH